MFLHHVYVELWPFLVLYILYILYVYFIYSIYSMYSVDNGDEWWWMRMDDGWGSLEGGSLLYIEKRETLRLLYRGEGLPHPSSSIIIHHHPSPSSIYSIYYVLEVPDVYLIYYLLGLPYRWWWWVMMDDDGWGSLSPLYREERHSFSCIEKKVSLIHHHPSSPITIIYILDVLYVLLWIRYILYLLYVLCRWWWWMVMEDDDDDDDRWGSLSPPYM